MAEGGGRCGDTLVAGATLGPAGTLGAPLIGATVVSECAGLGVTGGGAFRAISPAEPLRPELASGPTDGFDSIAGEEFEIVEGTFAKDSDSRVLSLGFSSEGAASPGLLAAQELSESVNDCEDGLAERDSAPSGGVEDCEVISLGRFGSAGEAASPGNIDFCASRSCFPSGPRPTVSPTVRLITANKNTDANAAT